MTHNEILGGGGHLGVALVFFVFGIILIVLGLQRGNRRNIRADHGSISVGGSNSGSIVNASNNSQRSSGSHIHWLTVVGIIVELAAIATVLWSHWGH
jgi:nitrate/nitrite transporter NarK